MTTRLGPLLVHRVLFNALGTKKGIHIRIRGKTLGLRPTARWQCNLSASKWAYFPQPSLQQPQQITHYKQ